jgi:hypothetical protein
MEDTLGIGGILKPKPKGIDYYYSEEFSKRILVDVPDIDSLQKIGAYYPNYEFLMLFEDGDLVIFDTDGGGMMRPVEIVTCPDTKREMIESARNIGDRYSLWEDVESIHIDGATIWCRAL